LRALRPDSHRDNGTLVNFKLVHKRNLMVGDIDFFDR
jgi:hypothetical protein